MKCYKEYEKSTFSQSVLARYRYQTWPSCLKDMDQKSGSEYKTTTYKKTAP